MCAFFVWLAWVQCLSNKSEVQGARRLSQVYGRRFSQGSKLRSTAHVVTNEAFVPSLIALEENRGSPNATHSPASTSTSPVAAGKTKDDTTVTASGIAKHAGAASTTKTAVESKAGADANNHTPDAGRRVIDTSGGVAKVGIGNPAGATAATSAAKEGAQVASAELIRPMTGSSAEESAIIAIEAAPPCPPKLVKKKAKASMALPKKARTAPAAGKSDVQHLLHQLDGLDLMEATFYI